MGVLLLFILGAKSLLYRQPAFKELSDTEQNYSS